MLAKKILRWLSTSVLLVTWYSPPTVCFSQYLLSRMHAREHGRRAASCCEQRCYTNSRSSVFIQEKVGVGRRVERMRMRPYGNLQNTPPLSVQHAAMSDTNSRTAFDVYRHWSPQQWATALASHQGAEQHRRWLDMRDSGVRSVLDLACERSTLAKPFLKY